MPNILVVEDDENLNRGITFSLKKSGYQVFSAETIKKAKLLSRKIQKAALAIKKKYGKNAILKAMNLEEGATAKDRNAQIGGHKA